MDEKRVLVTGIGGNVGQGILRNIRATTYNIKLVGTNIEEFSAGNHLCDVFYKIPYAYNDNYIIEICTIVETENIDLIIPSTDYEIYYLSLHKSKIPCEIVVSSLETTANYLDKYNTYLHHKKHHIPFGESYLPSQYKNQFKDCILKPRKGRGSRGLQINPESYSHFSDEEYMVQQLHKGTEITTAFYVNKKNELHGFITLERMLENGTTTNCKVVTTHDKILRKILQKVINAGQFCGSANLQSIVNNDGDIIPFEINCRISGTNSIRANFGFEDVKYTLQEYLYHETPDVPQIKKGVATRILMDVIYKDQDDYTEVKDANTKHFIY
jgi:carbamoyl-phosphate synthase large subunit